jgi:hypothetical protein
MVFITHVHMAEHRGSRHEHIASVRWRNPATGATGQSTVEQMVAFLEASNDNRAQVSDGTRRVEVGVVDGSPKYLRTHADGVWTDNLLSLPRY